MTQLTGPQATRAGVLHALADSSWVHFACHAIADHASPERSRFALWDTALTLEDLEALPTRSRELAFLSACHTAAGSSRHPDEAIHLAAAMLFLGYRHVIAASWTIADRPMPRVADAVYTVLTGGGAPDGGLAALALHRAVRSLRSTAPTAPELWAPYVHFGT
jgi:CHAT domain-containing protein